MKYTSFSYLYPPRPDDAIPPASLGFYEKKGFFCQIKKNGTSNVMAVTPDRQIIANGRHNAPHKAWQPDENTRRAFLGLKGGWYVFVSELMHNKVPGLRNINYINDILVADNDYLVGTTFEQRQDLLRDLFPDAVEHISGHYKVIDEHTWLAENYDSGFSALFKMLNDKNQPEDEGIVLKDSKAKLAICSKANSNSGWQKKCRLTTKNFAF